MNALEGNILRTLLYFDIFSHPLCSEELFLLLPQNSVTEVDFVKYLDAFAANGSPVSSSGGYYFVGDNSQFVELRKFKEKISKKAWLKARIVTHIIKRFPFVRAVFVTGTLSKNSSVPGSDLDFMVVTKARRLWICRTLLMAFKKIFLFNSYKNFCINYFISEDSLEIEEKNIYTATEIVYSKATFNLPMMNEFLKCNAWVLKFFPNYSLNCPAFSNTHFETNDRESYIKRFAEFFFPGKSGDRIDYHFKKITSNHWKKKFPHIDETDRNHMFKSTDTVSKSHPGNMQKLILENYRIRLQSFNLETDE